MVFSHLLMYQVLLKTFSVPSSHLGAGDTAVKMCGGHLRPVTKNIGREAWKFLKLTVRAP